MKNVKKVNTVKQKNINEIIGENIVNLLHINNISIQAACDTSRERFIHLSRQTLSKATKGETELTITQLLDICQFFGVSLDFLMGKTPYTNPDARAAGEYIGFTPASTENLHANKYFRSMWVFDFMMWYHPNEILNLLYQIGAACLCHAQYEVFDTLAGSDVLNADNIDSFINILAGRNPAENKKDAVTWERITIQDTVRDIIENIEPVHLMAFLLQKAYIRQQEDKNNLENLPEIKPDDYKQTLSDFEKINKLYNEEISKKKRRKRQQDIEKFQ